MIRKKAGKVEVIILAIKYLCHATKIKETSPDIITSKRRSVPISGLLQPKSQ